jgi:hypothetical protein
MSPEQVVEMLIGMHAQLSMLAQRVAEPGTKPVGAAESEMLIGLRAQTMALMQHFTVAAEAVEPEPELRRRVTFGGGE